MTSQKKILVPSEDSESWRLLLADPETQWQSGYSAKCIAESWERFGDFPQEIKSLFNNCHLLEVISKPPRNNHDAGNVKECGEGK